MPDDPISTTPTIGLGQWEDKKNPGADALNDNWNKIDAAVAALRTTDDGHDAAITALSTEVSEAVEDVASAIQKDGSIAMEADLDFGGNKAKNLAAGVDGTDGVNVTQLEAAVEAAVGGLSGVYKYVLARLTTDQTGTSPQIFAPDEDDDSSTDGQTFHDGGGASPEEFEAPQDGFYLIQARIKVEDAGGASLLWFVNGTEAPASVFPPILADVGENATFIVDTLLTPLSAGDIVTLKVYGLLTEPIKIMAGSTIAMTLLLANAQGGGDLTSTGTIPMTAPFDNGGQQSKNGADATDPTDLTTLEQVETLIDDAVESISPAASYAKEMAKIDVASVGAPGARSDIAGLTVTVDHAGGPLEARFCGSLSVTAFSQYTVYFVINGVVYPFSIMNQNNGARGDYTAAWGASAMIARDLPAGTYTIKMQHIGVNATLLAGGNPLYQATMVVDYLPAS